MTIYVPGKVTLANEFTVQDYMWQFPQQYGLWSPADITTALWLDAADASTITESGGAVSQWDDKSGNDRNVSQSNSLLRPTFSSTAFNGKQSIVFSGLSNSRLSGTGTGLSTVASIFVVVQDTGSISDIAGIYSSGHGSFGLYRTAGNVVISDGAGANAGNSSNTTSAIDQPSIVSAIYTQASTNGTSVFFNGALEESFTGQGVNVPAHPSDFEIGGRTSGNQSSRVFKGNISEVIVLAASASTDIRQRIEGYLAHKWGLTANLPAGHPYKTVGPTP